jgi:hypothetical protein
MANPDHLKTLKGGIENWNKWRSKHSEIKPDLSRADLSGAKLIQADLSQVDLSGSNLRKALLGQANCHRTDLRGCDLSGSVLWETDFLLANLSGASLCDSRLVGTHFRATELRGANLTGAKVGWTSFSNIDLSHTVGLETCIHEGPSTVGIDTIFKSGSTIPASFWFECGVPEQFITYAQSLVAQPFEFYSCFISYSTLDQEFADRLHADLQAEGVRCWFSPHDVRAGRRLNEQIEEAIRIYDRLLLILSPNSMNSEWVRTEIEKARRREKQERESGRPGQILFPLRLVSFEIIRDWECFDADTGKDSARDIREYFIPDFSNWKNRDSYQKEFLRLVRDLTAKKSSALL